MNPPSGLHSRYQFLKQNLANMAELTLEQVLMLSDALERSDFERAQALIQRDDLIDELEKENDNISQMAILEAVVTRREMGMEAFAPETVLKKDPLRFALSAIRITRNLERLCDNVVNAARAFLNGHVPADLFQTDESFRLILSRVITIVGMAVESLVEEKDRFFGSIRAVDEELDRRCKEIFNWLITEESINRAAFADIYRIVLSLERVGDLAVNVAEELVRLSTGQDIRHRDNLLNQQPTDDHRGE
ncbi:MAG: PhoU family transcriptional regulator [Leptospiraceae bacterium]|nr:PhoU family transcriptional regulator [Leptospiraceae bacterium]